MSLSKGNRIKAPNTGWTENSVGIDLGRKPNYPLGMTTKQKAVNAVKSLPDDASFEDALDRILLLAKIERGLQQLDAGRSIPHEKMKTKMKKWLR